MVPSPYPIADQWFSDTVPYRSRSTARSSAGRTAGSRAVLGSTISVALSVPHRRSFTKSVARSRNVAASGASIAVSAVTEQKASTR